MSEIPPTGLAAHLVARRGEFELDLELSVRPGRTLAVIGPNGAGKSTALGALAGILESTSSIDLNGRAIQTLPPEKRRVGYVFQDYLLFPHLTVLENVAFGARAGGAPRGAARERARWVLESLDVAELAQRRPSEVSGGQAQRIALARALASEPELLLLDEPLAALDVRVRSDMREQLALHTRAWSGLMILVTHDLDDVAAIADDVVVLEHGRASQRGALREVLASPATPYVERLVSRWAED